MWMLHGLLRNIDLKEELLSLPFSHSYLLLPSTLGCPQTTHPLIQSSLVWCKSTSVSECQHTLGPTPPYSCLMSSACYWHVNSEQCNIDCSEEPSWDDISIPGGFRQRVWHQVRTYRTQSCRKASPPKFYQLHNGDRIMVRYEEGEGEGLL